MIIKKESKLNKCLEKYFVKKPETTVGLVFSLMWFIPLYIFSLPTIKIKKFSKLAIECKTLGINFLLLIFLSHFVWVMVTAIFLTLLNLPESNFLNIVYLLMIWINILNILSIIKHLFVNKVKNKIKFKKIKYEN